MFNILVKYRFFQTVEEVNSPASLLGAGVTYKIEFDTFIGNFTILALVLHNSTISSTAFEILNPLPIDEIYPENASGQNLIGSSALLATYLNEVLDFPS